MLKAELTAAVAVDVGLPDTIQLSIGEDGTPHFRQLATRSPPAGLADFEQEVRARMPEQHLFDILKRAEHWSRYTQAWFRRRLYELSICMITSVILHKATIRSHLST